jgi:Adenylate and Guanylate cyclase catalytic domain
MSDAVLVYFGYPQAHEDDAERAVRAALELIAAVSALKAPASLQARVGIATGAVSLECSRLPRTPKPTLGTLTQSCCWDIRYQAPPNSFFLAMVSARRDRP